MKTVTSAASVPQLPSVETSIAVEVNVGPEMEKAIKIAQIQNMPKNISTNKFATKQRK